MSNSYENEINSLVDGIMKVAEEATDTQGMKKEARIFGRKKKSELGANKEKANAMFSGIGSDDSASDPKGKINRKWKRIKARFFKKANENTEDMLEKIAASAETDIDVLLDYIEKIATEEGIEGQDIVDTLYEDVEEYDDEDDEEYDDEEYDDEEYDDEEYDDEDDEEYGEEVEAEAIVDAIEKVAGVVGLDESAVLDYISTMAAENEIDELEVLAALEDEANSEIEKEAASVFRHAGNAKRKIRQGVGRLRFGDGYDDMYETKQQAKVEKAKLKTKDRNLKDYYAAQEAAMDARDKAKMINFKRFAGPNIGLSAVRGGVGVHRAGGNAAAGMVAGGLDRAARYGLDFGGRAVHKSLKKTWNDARASLDERDDLSERKKREAKERKMTEKEAFDVLIGEAIEKVAYAADVDGDDVIDYVEKLAYENDVDEIEVLAELEKEAMKMPKFVGNTRDRVGGFAKSTRGKFDGSKAGKFVGKHPRIAKGTGIAAGSAAVLGAGLYGANKYKKRRAEAEAEAEKEAFDVLIGEAIEKVAYAADVDGDDVIDYVEKLAYENDVDEIEVLAALEKEAEEDTFEMLVGEAIEKVAYVAGVDGDDVIDYVEKLAYENDVDEIEVLAELEKEAAPAFVGNIGGKIKGFGGKAGNVAKNTFVGNDNIENFKKSRGIYDGMKMTAQSGQELRDARKSYRKAGFDVAKRPAAIGAGLGAAVYGGTKLKKRLNARKAREEEARLAGLA